MKVYYLDGLFWRAIITLIYHVDITRGEIMKIKWQEMKSKNRNLSWDRDGDMSQIKDNFRDKSYNEQMLEQR